MVDWAQNTNQLTNECLTAHYKIHQVVPFVRAQYHQHLYQYRQDVKVWVVQNKLQLNDDKAEILLVGSAPGIDLPSSVRVGQSDISFSSAARNLGVVYDSELALKEPVNRLCELAYLEIRMTDSI